MEEFERSGEIIVELGSDQTSCHNPFNGGYYPIQLNFEEAQEVSLIINAQCRKFERTTDTSLNY